MNKRLYGIHFAINQAALVLELSLYRVRAGKTWKEILLGALAESPDVSPVLKKRILKELDNS